MKSIVRISDGLGNQLFQYAFGYSVHKMTGMDIVLDPMFISPLRRYQLDAFNLDFNQRFVSGRMDYILGLGPRKARKPRLAYRDRKIQNNAYELVKERQELQYDASIYTDREAYYLGFWQSYLYFDQYYQDLKRQIVLKDKISAKAEEYSKRMQSTMSVSCHIRRTDYNREVNNVCVNNIFYKNALDIMQEQIGDFELFIFTDDKQFVKDNFRLHDYTIVEGTSDLEDFILMQKCRNHIIANSTFSWWGAYLSQGKGGVVCAPLADMWTRDFYLPEWNCIETGVGNTNWKE